LDCYANDGVLKATNQSTPASLVAGLANQVPVEHPVCACVGQSGCPAHPARWATAFAWFHE